MHIVFEIILREDLDNAKKTTPARSISEQESKINEFIRTLSFDSYKDELFARDLMMKGYLLGFIKVEKYKTL